MIDALARHWAGVPIVDAGPPYWLMKPDNAPADTSKDFPLVEDYKAQVDGALGQGLIRPTHRDSSAGPWAGATRCERA